VAGHDDADATLFIDTHAAPVKYAVYDLLELALERTGAVPVVLERDDDFPPWDELLAELEHLAAIVARAAPRAPT
jgi:uncharacterized protein (UPF0276 family)